MRSTARTSQASDLRLRRIRLRHDRLLEAELGGLFEAILAPRCRPDFAGESDLAEGNDFRRNRLVGERRDHRKAHREVGRRLADAHAAHGIDEDVLFPGRDAGMAMQHREEHGEPVRFQADGKAARIGRMRRVHQRLDLDQQGARAFKRGQDAGARHGFAMIGQEQLRRIADPAQPFLRHREHTELVDRAETVLHRAHQPKGRVRVALEVEHGVDDVLEHARPGDRALLRDVADEEQRAVAAFGEARELRRALAHLRHRAGRGLQRFRPERLDGIDHRDAGPRRLQRPEHALELRLGRDANTCGVEPQAPRAQRHLLHRFLTGHIENRLRERAQGLQQQRGLADARIAAEQRHLPRHQSAAQRAVELADAGGDALLVARLDVRKRHRRCRGAVAPHAAALGRWSPSKSRRRRTKGMRRTIAAPSRRTRSTRRRFSSSPSGNFGNRHARGQLAEELVAQRTGRRCDLVGRKALAPQRNR